jgi:2,3-bisphosphoglycerate-dependent phosphoglycerate mutase
MKFLFSTILLFITLASCQAQKEPTTLIIVRHAEKLTTGDDPGLTPIGQDRADRLAQMLERQTITAVYFTGVPTASGNSLEVMEYDPSDAEGFLKEVLGKHSGETILITGHSNTVPAMVNLLTGSSMENFTDDDYGNLFVITGSELGGCSSLNLFF